MNALNFFIAPSLSPENADFIAPPRRINLLINLARNGATWFDMNALPVVLAQFFIPSVAFLIAVAIP